MSGGVRDVLTGRWAAGRPISRVVVAGVMVSAAVEAAAIVTLRLMYTPVSPVVIAMSAGVGLLFVVAGLIGQSLRPASSMGLLMVVAGLLWNAGRLQGPAPFPMVAVALPATSLGLSLIVYMLLGIPTGRLASKRDRAIVLMALLAGARDIPSVRGENPLGRLVESTAFTTLGNVVNLLGIVTIGAVIAVAVIRWGNSSTAARRPLAPLYLAALLIGLRAVAQEAALGVGLVAKGSDLLMLLELASFALIPAGVLLGLLRARLARSAVADLVIELGETPEPARLRSALARALGDPGLEVLRWSDERDCWLDDANTPFDPATRAPGRALTLLERDGRSLAGILHDPALLDDPALMPSVATAMRLEVENERLQAEVERQLAEVRLSRARIVEASDAERRRVERNLHDGAQQRLVSLTLSLRLLRSRIGSDSDPAVLAEFDSVADELKIALTELRELARGIHPAVLGQAGLGAALLALAERSPIPVVVEEAPEGRLPENVETTAYFVVAEGLTNVAKYADASKVTLRAHAADGCLTLELQDDGVGGADPVKGSGLRGLTDRVEALGGRLSVASPLGHGTRLLVELPLDVNDAAIR